MAKITIEKIVIDYDSTDQIQKNLVSEMKSFFTKKRKEFHLNLLKLQGWRELKPSSKAHSTLLDRKISSKLRHRMHGNSHLIKGKTTVRRFDHRGHNVEVLTYSRVK